MPYRFGYAVKDEDGNDFNQQEQSDGEQVHRDSKKRRVGYLHPVVFAVFANVMQVWVHHTAKS
jgi:hypothetical protein